MYLGERGVEGLDRVERGEGCACDVLYEGKINNCFE